LGGSGLARLLGRRSRQWRRLDLSANVLYRSDLRLLRDSASVNRLAALDLDGNALGDHGASMLADWPAAVELVDLGLANTGTGDGEVAALASSRNLTSLRSLDLRSHNCSARVHRESDGGIGELSRSPLLGQLRRLLLGPRGQSNGWTAKVLAAGRRRRGPALVNSWWTSALLRQSRYLMPSQLLECDLEELWWLGDTARRERLPTFWTVDD
jgi:hypothetical protein